MHTVTERSPRARAALAGGATWLATATAAEALELRRPGIDAPILVMGALSRAEAEARGRSRGGRRRVDRTS